MLSFQSMLEVARALAVRSVRQSLGMPRFAKRIVVMTIDASLALVAVWLAFYLRLGDWTFLVSNQWLTALLALAALPIFWLFQVYRAIFRHIGFDALIGLSRACLVYGLLYASIFTFLGVADVPRTIGLIQPILLFLLAAGSRVLLRRILVGVPHRSDVKRVMIYGAGTSGRQLAAAIAGSGEMQLLGFVDDDPQLRGAVLKGRKIYASSELSLVVSDAAITEILLALPSVTHKRRGEILEMLRPLGVNVRTVPDLMDLATGRWQVTSLRPLEIEDLLGRDVAPPDPVLFGRNIFGKSVLVTGAGGSIGSELCRQILTAKPNTIILVELSEYALYTIDMELRRRLPEGDTTQIIPLLANVRDESRIAWIMKTWRPDTVYHAAAYKHVPLVESNSAEGVMNNVMGTYNTARAAMEFGVSDFVLISTDKAVRPTNIMGATKRLAEQVLQALASTKPQTTFSMVRFGNVLGSSGSVVPLFRSQIANGGPVTITHEEVTRFFMTIPEAAQLVIQAGAMARGGEVFILDMGEPVRIIDLARKMIELSGFSVRDAFNPDGEIEIVVVGLRPGEKLYEELLIGDNPSATTNPLIMKAMEGHLSLAALKELLARLSTAVMAQDICATNDLLREGVPEFTLGEVPATVPVPKTRATAGH